MKRRVVFVLALLVILGTSAGSALAGGWATVTLDERLPAIAAGQPQRISFYVWQHGQTPVHFLEGDNWPVQPVLVATHTATGETIEATAERAEEVGRFVVEVTFPSDGTWEWQIRPEPLMLEGTLPPLTVLPAPVPAATPEAPAPITLAVWLPVAAAVIALGLLGLWTGRQGEGGQGVPGSTKAKA
jgi:hypothetical protein